MLKVQDLSAHSPNEALFGVSFEVPNGQVLAVVGKSDSGKHLLGAVLAGNPLAGGSVTSGEVHANSYRYRTHRQKVQIQTGYLANPVQLEEFLTGYELLDLIGSLYHLAPVSRSKQIETLSSALDIGSALYGVIERETLATRQKIALIATVIHAPKVLILDEPTQSLDFAGRGQVGKLIDDQASQGSSIVLITDNLELAEHSADEIIVLEQGQILLNGTLQQLINQTKTRTHTLKGVMETLFGDG
ncbi:MAG: ATP-binding cassette domain-containing protein [bacterium]|nr:ATP-binding cassette domain-containing protein [bacterium]